MIGFRDKEGIDSGLVLGPRTPSPLVELKTSLLSWMATLDYTVCSAHPTVRAPSHIKMAKHVSKSGHRDASPSVIITASPWTRDAAPSLVSTFSEGATLGDR